MRVIVISTNVSLSSVNHHGYPLVYLAEYKCGAENEHGMYSTFLRSVNVGNHNLEVNRVFTLQILAHLMMTLRILFCWFTTAIITQ